MKTNFYQKPKHKKFNFTLLIPALILTFLFQASCSKLEDDLDFNKLITPDWNPEFAVPLVNSTLYIADFFEDTSNLTIITGDDNSFTFIYESSNLITVRAEDFIDFKDQDFVFYNTFDLPGSPPGVIDTLSYPQQFQFFPDTADQAIDSIFFKNGNLRISGRSNLDRNTSYLELTSTSIRRKSDNSPLLINANISNPDGSEWVYFDTTIHLGDYKFILSQTSDTIANVMYLNQDIIITNDDNPDQSPYELILEGELSEMEFEGFFGYLAQYDFPLNDSINVGLFDNTIGGGISIGSGAVNLKFNIDNSFGIPITIVGNSLYAYSPVNEPDRIDIELFGPGVPNNFEINSPGFNQIGETIENVLDFSDANFSEAFNISPQKLYYEVTAATNYSSTKNEQNFILSESAISLAVDLEVNLFAAVQEFIVEDTVSINMETDLEEIDYVTIRFGLTNAFPVDVTAQVYFADENYNILDSLLTDGGNILPGAPVSGPPEYAVTESVSKTTDITLDRKGIDNLIKAEYLFIRTAISTTDEGLVKFYPENYLGLKMGIISGLSIESN
jgi:hypothetical protein